MTDLEQREPSTELALLIKQLDDKDHSIAALEVEKAEVAEWLVYVEQHVVRYNEAHFRVKWQLAGLYIELLLCLTLLRLWLRSLWLDASALHAEEDGEKNDRPTKKVQTTAPVKQAWTGCCVM